MLRFMTIRRFNYIDILAMAVLTAMVANGHLAWAVFVYFAMTAVSVILEDHARLSKRQ